MSLTNLMTKTLVCGDRKLDLSRPIVMGILNVTPDSFSDGGQYTQSNLAVTHAQKMVNDGATIIDVGGESTRPGAAKVSIEQELERVIPVIESIRRACDVVISVDTSKAEVMTAAINAGAGMVNDVRALQSPGALQAAAQSTAAVCLMHMQGQPENMQNSPQYGDITEDIITFLAARVDACLDAGIDKQQLLVDPGFGFGKTTQQNYTLVRKLDRFSRLGLPLLVGVSRKSMIGAVIEREPSQRLAASIALALITAQKGAAILRVHDVAETVDALKMLELSESYDE